MLPPATWARLIEKTWPCASRHSCGPFVLRNGQGGGKRVCAASLLTPPFCEEDLPHAEAAMRAMGQPALFAIWPDMPQDMALDAALARRGYQIIDPVVIYHGMIDAILETNPQMTQTTLHWPAPKIGQDIWQAAGIGPARWAVMARAKGAKSAVLAQSGAGDALGICFVAVSGSWAMVHALEVAPPHRRQGIAHSLLARAAHWAGGQGAANLGVVVTQANLAARALYAKLGMVQGGRYHYRQLGP